jgi:P27 family predicted phage terminase small subunit
MAGRPRKPKALDDLEGNPGKRAKGAEPKTTGTPTCPMWLDKDAKSKWRKVAKWLKVVGGGTADAELLAVYCQTWSIWKEAVKSIQVDGITVTSKRGGPIRNPAVTIANDAAQTLSRLGSQLGWSPTTRAKLAEAPEEKKSKMASLLAG